MRIGLISQNFLESIALRSGVGPTPIILGFWGLGACRTIMAGVRLGVFDALAGPKGRKGKSADDLARELECDPTGMETLLNALVGYGYLVRRDHLYRNRSLAERWLTTDSKSSLKHMLLFFYQVWGYMDSVEEAVRGRETIPLLHDPARSPELWEHYLRGLAELARHQSWEMVRRVPIPKAPRSLLDVGGGHGMFSVAFCRYYKTLNAEVLELAPAIPIGRRIVAEQKMDHRVRFREGDLREADFGSGHDAILLFVLVHHFSPEDVQRLVKKSYHALRPGGTLAIFEPEHRGRGNEVTQGGGMMELIFFLTSRARAYPEKTLCGWLEEARFEQVQTHRLLTAPMTVLITGRRPSD